MKVYLGGMGKILVTGAAGFIGSNLVDFLLRDGVKKKDLRLFILRGESLDNLKHLNSLDIFKGNLNNKNDTKKAMKGVSVVYHLGAHATGKVDKKFEVNYVGTRNLIECCKNKRIKKFILFSSIAVYGLPAFVGDNMDINEESAKKPIGGYALSKMKAEKELVLANKKYKIPYAIIRPTTVYGPRDKAGIYQLFKIIKSRFFVKVGDGKNKVDYVYVDDVIRAARLAEKISKNGDYIIGFGEPIEFNEIIESISKSVDVRVFDFFIPKSLAVTLGCLVDFLNGTFDLQIPFSADRARVMSTNYYFNSIKAKSELKYSAKVSFKEGTRLTAEWLNQNGLI